MKKILFCLLLLVTLSVALAESELSSQVQALSEQVQGVKLQGPVSILFGNVRVNLYVKTTASEEVVIGIVTKDKIVQSVGLGAIENPSLKVYTDEATINEIQNAQNSISALQQALKEKKITYTAIGFKNRVKFGFLSSFVKVASWFKGGEVKEVKTEKKEEKAAAKESEPKKETAPVKEEKEKPKEENKVEVKTEAETKGTESQGPTTHYIKITSTGFNPQELTVKVGDTVEWENTRNGQLSKAMVLGTRQCVTIRSSVLASGKKFSHTFDKPGTCTFVDGIITTLTGMVTAVPD